MGLSDGDEDIDPARLIRVDKNSQLLEWDAKELPSIDSHSLVIGENRSMIGPDGLLLVDEERIQAKQAKLIHGVHAKIIRDGERLMLHVIGKEMCTFINEKHYRVIDKAWQQHIPP